MKNLFICTCLLISAAACSPDQAAYEARAENEIMQAIQAQRVAWNEGDMDGFLAWYLEDEKLRFTTSRGVLKGFDQLSQRYKDAYPNKNRMGAIDFDILEFRSIDPSNAVVIGKWMLFREGEQLEGYFTLIWTKTADDWRIAIDHTS